MSVDLTSLLVGLAIATILWWMISRGRPLGRQVADGLTTNRSNAGDRSVSEVEISYRRLIFRRAQGMHLAARLFPLDEILEEPLLLSPPARVEPDGPVASEDAVTLTVPYLPAWPDLAAAYEAPTMPLGQALAAGARIVVIGQPGAGKTITLAHLASLAANRSESLAQLREQIPFLLHVGELQLPLVDRKALLGRIIDSAALGVSVFDIGRVERFVRAAFREGRALLLLDGFDELTEAGQRSVSQYIADLIKEFPRLRLVVTGAPEHLDGLIRLEFFPLAVAPWNPRRQADFLKRWVEVWSRRISADGTMPSGRYGVDPMILAKWLQRDHGTATPLEHTLQAWAACAGDGLGSRNLDAITAHIRRLIPAGTPPEALEALAVQVMLTAQPLFDPRKARAWISEFELPEELKADPGQLMTAATASGQGIQAAQEPDTHRHLGEATTAGLLGRLASTGLLSAVGGNHMRFVHPVFGGYLAGRGLRTYKAGDTLINQPDWIGKLLTMRYFSAHGDASALVSLMLNWARLPSQRPLLTCARWLKDAPITAAWRGPVLSSLTELVQRAGLPLALRGQALVALAVAGDQSVALVFRQMISSPAPDVAQLAALGSGLIRDVKAIPALKGLLLSANIVARRAACLALVAIGTTEALEAVAEALLRGEDELRRAAAEALANEPIEGHAMLKDGATMQDIPLRRAVAYGLGRVMEPWSLQLLEKMRVEDDQWIVRNAAGEMIENRSRSLDPRTPRPLTPPSECPWLIRFAGTQGLGISAGAPATEVLLAALRSPHSDERLGAVEYLRLFPDDGVIKQLYSAMLGDDYELREAAFLVIAEIGASGISLPDPTKFGLN
ncbi:MAG TPA: HEAT repeat domain-containing protein [Anaerolineales bacterium]